MQKNGETFTKLPKHLLSLIIFLVVLLLLLLGILFWYDQKIAHIQDQEQQLRNPLSATRIKTMTY